MAGSSAVDAAAILDALDDEQRVVAENLRGPVRVLAGAGTGKTRAITHRVAYGIHTGTYAADRVLAVTFTQRAAGEMRTRLRELGAGSVAARTFHASALRQLNFFWPQITGAPAPRVVDSKARPLAEAAATLRISVDTAVLRDLAGEIEWRKSQNLTVAAYAQVAPGRPQPGSLTLDQCVALMNEYERIKDERSQIDFDDVLLLTVGMLESEPNVVQQVREQYRFFVVDEYQDVSPLQHRLLQLWRGDRTDVCVVGDVSQTIYSFTGATSDYLLDFEREFPGAVTVRLERDYRSTEPIVQVANALMRHQAGALTLRSMVELPGGHRASLPSLAEFDTDVTEARAVAERIKSDVAAGLRPENVAIIFRTNAQSAQCETALDEAGIPCHVSGSARFFDIPDVRRALLALRGAAVVPSPEPLFKSVSDIVRALGWTQSPPDGGGAVRSRWEVLNTLIEMAEAMPSGSTLADFSRELLARAEARHEPTLNAVTLASIHSVKGMEWECVYVVGLAEGLLPISYASSPQAIAEERRLFYVAITRAKRTLRLSWARQAAGRRGHREASRFLAECGTNTIRVEQTAR